MQQLLIITSVLRSIESELRHILMHLPAGMEKLHTIHLVTFMEAHMLPLLMEPELQVYQEQKMVYW